MASQSPAWPSDLNTLEFIQHYLSPSDCSLMFSHTGSNAFPVSFLETVSFYSVVLPSYLFSVLHYGSTVFHSQLQEKVCGDFFFFFCLPFSTIGKYEADPVYVCCNLKRSWYAVVIKEESRAVYPAEEYQSSKLESPPGPPGQLWRALCCSPRTVPKHKAKTSATESASCPPGTDKMSDFCLYKKSRVFFLCMNMFFEIWFPEAFCTLNVTWMHNLPSTIFSIDLFIMLQKSFRKSIL